MNFVEIPNYTIYVDYIFYGRVFPDKTPIEIEEKFRENKSINPRSNKRRKNKTMRTKR